MSTTLRDLAHCRSGDKGHLTTLAVTARRSEHFALLAQQVTPDRVARQLRDRVGADVVRHDVLATRTLLFVCSRAAVDTVTTSLHLDTHGKTLAGLLADMPIDEAAPRG